MKSEYAPIGFLQTPFREKFGTPRQALLVPSARGILKLNDEPGYLEALDQLDGFSHLWLVFVFHQHIGQAWRPRVSPPRVEIEKVGVFASRSPHRPNPIGMSAVCLERIDRAAKGGAEIHLGGVDLLDGTPVLDIKPYLGYADSIPEARCGWAEEAPRRYEVSFSPAALEKISSSGDPIHLRHFLEQTLALDPRPRSQKETMPFAASAGKIFRFRLAGYDIEWQIQAEKILVLDLLTCP